VKVELVLASTSARRRAMLAAAGFEAVSIAPAVDDGALRIRHDHASENCCAVAWFKGAQILNDRARMRALAPNARFILSADTVCVVNGQVLGKPRDAHHARLMLESSRNQTQSVVTGVCIVGIEDNSRALFADRAVVRLGDLSDRWIAEHIAAGGWIGRAGGYNLEELVAAGVPVECVGDPSTVVGLPMRMLVPILTRMIGGSVVSS